MNSSPAEEPPPDVQAGFERALEALAGYDRKHAWTASRCREVAQSFFQLHQRMQTARNQALPDALYNAGLAAERCQDWPVAMRHFRATVEAQPDHLSARIRLVLGEHRADSISTEEAIRRLDGAVRQAHFRSAEGLVALGALQMQAARRSESSQLLERAKQNLQRALAFDDSYVPALNQLALYYLELARGEGDQPRLSIDPQEPNADSQTLDLASLVISQALQKDPKSPSLHNTAGNIHVTARRYNQAIESFARARALDRNLFAAQMNYAALSISIRGFAEAEEAYLHATELKPKSYEAHLGLALALRGQIPPLPERGRLSSTEYQRASQRRVRQVQQARAAIKTARQLAPDRPEAFFNDALLAYQFEAQSSSQAKSGLKRAYCQFGAFLDRSQSQDEPARTKAQQWREDILASLAFMQGHEPEVTCNSEP